MSSEHCMMSDGTSTAGRFARLSAKNVASAKRFAMMGSVEQKLASSSPVSSGRSSNAVRRFFLLAADEYKTKLPAIVGGEHFLPARDVLLRELPLHDVPVLLQIVSRHFDHVDVQGDRRVRLVGGVLGNRHDFLDNVHPLEDLSVDRVVIVEPRNSILLRHDVELASG